MVRYGQFALLAIALPISAATLKLKLIEDHSSSPVASAEVRVSKPGARPLAADLETDADGRFEAPGLPADEYRITISKPNFVTTTFLFRLSSVESTATVRLVRCGAITGHVMDRQGQPIRGATVYAMRKPTANAPLEPDFSSGHSSSVDTKGQYRLYNLPPGQYTVAVTYGSSSSTMGSTGTAVAPGTLGSGALFYPDNGRPQFLDISGGEEHRNIDFSIFAASLSTVSGTVQRPDAKSNFWVALASIGQPSLATVVDQTDATGAFKLKGVPAGVYFIFTSGPTRGYGGRGAVLTETPLFARSQVTVASQDVEGISLIPEKPASVAITLRASAAGAGACPTAAQVALTPMEDWAARLDKTVPVTLGKEEIVTGLAPARYALAVRGLGANCYATSEPVLDLSRPAAPLTITVAPAGSIRGKVDTGARPASGFAVVLLPKETGDLQIAYPDTAAKFAFTGLKPGKYRIAAQPVPETSQTRWVADVMRMFEVEVSGGGALEMDLAAPAPAK